MKINVKINFKDELVKFIKSEFPYRYNFIYKTQKYELTQLVDEFIYILETGVSYRQIRSNISKSNINNHFLFLSKHNIFIKFYKHF